MARSNICGRLAGTLVASFLVVGNAGEPSAQMAKPPVPGGTDPGGVAVALLGPGLDYTHPDIATRLARDGEGDPIGRDFTSNDNRPFEPADAGGRPGTAAALVLVRLVERVRLVAVREHPADPAAIGRMLAFTAQSPARIALWPGGSPSRRDWPILAEAARRFPDRLIIVPAPLDVGALTALPRLPNLVLAASEGRLVSARAPRGVVIPKGAGADVRDDWLATLWVGALAARTLALRPDMDAAALARSVAGMSWPQR